jgi:heme-degrading monooxygenase HmoA
MSALQGLDGFIGMSLLCDRDSGRCIATSAWESEEAMRDNADKVRPIREQALQMFGGGATVDEWDIAVLHRAHQMPEGAYARVTWGQTDPAHTDAAIDYFRSTILPDAEKIEGFCSLSLMVDRATGRGASCTTFDSREAMDRSRGEAQALKESRMKEAGASELDECEFEVAFAHLRVPELV